MEDQNKQEYQDQLYNEISSDSQIETIIKETDRQDIDSIIDESETENCV